VRVFVNILIIIILVIVTPVLLLVTSLKTNVLSTTFLKHELDRHDIYTVAFSMVEEQIKEMELAPEIPITHEEISSLITEVLTPEWLQGNVETVLDDFNTWLNAPPGTELSIILSLAEPKANLLTELDVLLEKKLAELESCTPEEENMLCMFAGLGLDDLKQELTTFDFNPEDLVNQLPDNFNLADPESMDIFKKSEEVSGENHEENTEIKTDEAIGRPPEGDVNHFEENFDGEPGPEQDEQDLAAMIAEIIEQLEQYKNYYHLGLKAFWYAWIIYIVLLAQFIILNATGGWRRLVRWTGALLLCIGLLPAVIGIGSSIVHEFVMGQIQFGPDFPAAVKDVVPKLINDVRQAVFTLPLIVGSILIGLGLAGTIGGHWIPKSKGADKSGKK